MTSVQDRSIFINKLISHLRENLSGSDYSIQSRVLDSEQNPQVEIMNGNTHEIVVLKATTNGLVCNETQILDWDGKEILSNKGEDQLQTFEEITTHITTEI